jgi:cysteine desulfurase
MMHSANIRPVFQGIYLDHNASTPLALKVRHVMHDLIEGDYGNSSSGHWASTGASNRLEESRRKAFGFTRHAPAITLLPARSSMTQSARRFGFSNASVPG